MTEEEYAYFIARHHLVMAMQFKQKCGTSNKPMANNYYCGQLSQHYFEIFKTHGGKQIYYEPALNILHDENSNFPKEFVDYSLNVLTKIIPTCEELISSQFENGKESLLENFDSEDIEMAKDYLFGRYEMLRAWNNSELKSEPPHNQFDSEELLKQIYDNFSQEIEDLEE